MADRKTNHLRSRLNASMRAWPRPLEAAFRAYLRSTGRASASASRWRNRGFGRPFWILLPSWLQAAYARSGKPGAADRDFLDDVLTGQYCLFLAFRLRDDLMDDPDTPAVLKPATDLLLREARTIFSGHFPPGDPFWRLYRRNVSGTARAIRTVDDLQRSAGSRPRALLRAYSLVNSVFRIGSAAVCRRHSRRSDYPVIRSFSDNFSAGCQILDDLEDVAQDLGRGRWNYAANFSLRRAGPVPARGPRVPDRVAGAIISGGAGLFLLDEARGLIGRAFSALEPLKLPLARRCRREYEASIDSAKLRLFAAGISARRGNVSIVPAAAKGRGR